MEHRHKDHFSCLVESKAKERRRSLQYKLVNPCAPPDEITGVQSNHFQSNQMRFSAGINFPSI